MKIVKWLLLCLILSVILSIFSYLLGTLVLVPILGQFWGFSAATTLGIILICLCMKAFFPNYTWKDFFVDVIFNTVLNFIIDVIFRSDD